MATKAHKKQTNPNKVPKTQADVDRSYLRGYEAGATDFLNVMVFTLGCDCDMSDEWLDFFHARFMANMDSHVNGELTTHDMRTTSYAEKGWEVEMK